MNYASVMKMTQEERQIAKFWRRVDKSPEPNGCWLWTGPMQNMGYGRMRFGGKDQLAHRISYKLAYGDWPANFGCHTCDNPKCVRPDHVYDGTHADNMSDCVSRGRNRTPFTDGHKRSLAKRVLTESDVFRILDLTADGIKPWSMHNKHGVRAFPYAIGLILKGITYRSEVARYFCV